MTVRDAVGGDSSDLAILADAATRRLVSWLWEEHAQEGQSSFEVGRSGILDNGDALTHLSKWAVVEVEQRVAGALNSYVLPPMPEPTERTAAVLQPLNELKALAVGTWYVSVASVHPEFRGQGVGHELFALADRKARKAGVERVTLLVGSFNAGAHRLYLSLGFREWQRRPFAPFPGSDQPGEWILMVKDL